MISPDFWIDFVLAALAIWRVSQPGPANRSKINPAAMPIARTMRNVMAGVMKRPAVLMFSLELE